MRARRTDGLIRPARDHAATGRGFLRRRRAVSAIFYSLEEGGPFFGLPIPPHSHSFLTSFVTRCSVRHLRSQPTPEPEERRSSRQP
ncbi:hypothetical protein VTO73DRAFT_107 [Trametes versicolor]